MPRSSFKIVKYSLGLTHGHIYEPPIEDRTNSSILMILLTVYLAMALGLGNQLSLML